MPIERTTFGGLNTDSPPDRLGDNAWYLKNVRPVSATSIRPREGVSEQALYKPLALGANLIIDKAPGSTTGLLVTVIHHSEGTGGSSVWTNEHIRVFFPSRLAGDYSSTSGLADSASLYGVIL